jgi:SRSO17 transposase
MMNVTQRAIENNSLYVKGLLKTEGRKVCTSIAETLNTTHDTVYKPFDNAELLIQNARGELQSIARDVFGNQPVYLLIDDFVINKQYSKEIEGTDTCYDTSTKHASTGLHSVSAMLTEGNIKIPIDASLFLSKRIGGENRTTKNKIAEEIIKANSFDRAIWDAHYTTHSTIRTCHEKNKSYLGKIPRNRIVTINGKEGQVQELVKLKKNRKILSVQAIFGGTPCWIHLIKRDDKRCVYLISNDYIEPKLIAKLYKIRWKIECFHRTSKQMLGMQQCQMRSFKKQELHVLSAMLAYAHAELIRMRYKLKHTEAAIRLIRAQK